MISNTTLKEECVLEGTLKLIDEGYLKWTKTQYYFKLMNTGELKYGKKDSSKQPVKSLDGFLEQGKIDIKNSRVRLSRKRKNEIIIYDQKNKKR